MSQYREVAYDYVRDKVLDNDFDVACENPTGVTFANAIDVWVAWNIKRKPCNAF